MPTAVNETAQALRVGFILSRQFTLSAFSLFVDTLRLASDELDRSRRVRCDWEVISSSRHLVTSSCGVSLAPTSSLGDPKRFDYLVVVGGLLNVEQPIDHETLAFLRKADAVGVKLVGVCTGSFVLASAGLLKGHKVCVSWLHHAEFKNRFPDLTVVSDQIFSIDRRRATCAGGSSAADFAAHLVRKHVGIDAERNAMEVLQIGKARSQHDAQARNPIDCTVGDRRIRSALLLMEQHIEDQLGVETIARRVGLSRRQLERLFLSETGKSPCNVYTGIRLEKAKSLLAHTEVLLLDIAYDLGFGSGAQFARLFKREFGLTPTGFRKQFARQ